MGIEFEIVTHEFEGRSFMVALDKAATDAYTTNLRKKPLRELFLSYILARAEAAGRPLKIADFGSNVGGISLPLAAHGMNVLAIEALPKNFLALAVSTRTNGFSNLLPINIAAYDSPGLVEMSGESAWAAIGTKANRASTLVAADTMAAILRTFDFADVDLVKIDIEGAEIAALTGMDEFLLHNEHVDFIYESNTPTCRNFGHDQQTLARCFEKLGFNLYAFRAGGLMQMRSDGPFPSHLLDILATKKSEAEVRSTGLHIHPYTEEHLLDSLLREVTTGHPFLLMHAELQEAFLSDAQKKSPQWQQVTEILKSKGVAKVANA